MFELADTIEEDKSHAGIDMSSEESIGLEPGEILNFDSINGFFLTSDFCNVYHVWGTFVWDSYSSESDMKENFNFFRGFEGVRSPVVSGLDSIDAKRYCQRQNYGVLLD